MKGPWSTEEAVRIIEKFDSLPIERRMEIFRNLSPEAGEELLETITQPWEIMNRISEEEMFFTIKQLGEENALNHIRLTNGKQLQYLLDIDLWNRDAFDSRAAERWLEILAFIGESKLSQLVQTVDPELLLTMLRGLVRIAVRDPDVDLTEQRNYLPSYTLDETFFVEFLVPEKEEAVARLLETLIGRNPKHYFQVMQELATGIHLENEEMAQKWRSARLADHGIPDFDEAVGIYEYQAPGAMATLIRDFEERSAAGPVEGTVLDYPLKVIGGDCLFSNSLDEISDVKELDQISLELAHLANKVIIADARDPGAVNEVTGALEKVRGYINIALEDSCGKDSHDASDMIRSVHMETLFRRGFSIVLELQRQAWRLANGSKGKIENLGYPLAELVKGLVSKRPIFAAKIIGEKENREFQAFEDVRLIRDMMDSAGSGDTWQPL